MGNHFDANILQICSVNKNHGVSRSLTALFLSQLLWNLKSSSASVHGLLQTAEIVVQLRKTDTTGRYETELAVATEADGV